MNFDSKLQTAPQTFKSWPMSNPALRPIPFWRRLCQTAIDVAIFYGVWVTVLELTKVRFPFGFMQGFSQRDYDAYIKIMTWMTLSLFLLSIVLHAVFGGSIGKLLMGHRTVHVDGSHLTLRAVALRSAVLFFLGLAILAPGPLVAFIFRAGSEGGSLAALLLGLGLWAIVALPWTRSRSLLEAYLGLITVRTRDLKRDG
jgi:uncharacterized RDD family membrane protein YckC